MVALAVGSTIQMAGGSRACLPVEPMEWLEEIVGIERRKNVRYLSHIGIDEAVEPVGIFDCPRNCQSPIRADEIDLTIDH